MPPLTISMLRKQRDRLIRMQAKKRKILEKKLLLKKTRVDLEREIKELERDQDKFITFLRQTRRGFRKTVGSPEFKMKQKKFFMTLKKLAAKL